MSQKNVQGKDGEQLNLTVPGVQSSEVLAKNFLCFDSRLTNISSGIVSSCK